MASSTDSLGGQIRITRRWHIPEITALLLLCIGVVCFGEAMWIKGKALLAQVLIARAWAHAQAGAPAPKPWPWADTTPIARLDLPSHAPREEVRELYVLEGASGRNLAFGPTHDSASVRPGTLGNSVIEGHRDTHFRALRDMRIGDQLKLQGLDGRWISFAVVDVRVVDGRRFRIVLHSDVPRLTLVTCYPFDAIFPGGPLRWVVTADRKSLGR